MHMANKQCQQNSHKWKTWQLGFQTLERYWVWPIFFKKQADYENEEFFIFFFFFFFFLGGGGGAQLQCIDLVLYIDLKAAEGN